MKANATVFVLLGALILWPYSAQAHCDAVDGPVATAALKALDTKNVNLILPGVSAARERVSAELAFIGYVEAIYVATKGGSHAE